MTGYALLQDFDNWNIALIINDNNLKRLYEFQHIHETMWLDENIQVKELLQNTEVVSFGVYDNDFCIRLDV